MKENYLTRDTLLRKLKNRHDETAWQEFADLYLRYIRSVLYNMQIFPDSIDDITQTVLLRAWEK